MKVVKDTTPFDASSCDKYYDYCGTSNVANNDTVGSSNGIVSDEIKAENPTILSDKEKALLKIREIVNFNGSNELLDEAVKSYNEAVVLTYSLTHSLSHSLTHSLTHSGVRGSHED